MLFRSHTNDVLRHLNSQRGSLAGLNVASLMSTPWFVPETTTLEEQLAAFREKGAHFALVVDEYGSLQGLVTLADILEEVFGNITERHDKSPRDGFRRQGDGSYNIDGSMPVRDVNRELDWDLPDEEATDRKSTRLNSSHT